MSFPTMAGAVPFSALYAAPTENPKAKIGQLAMDQTGGLWRYFRAGAAITNPLLVAGNYSQPSDCGVAEAAVGSWTIACDSLTVYDTVVKDQFANGQILIGAALANRRFYHIVSNPAASTDDVTVTLHHPVRYAIAGTEWATMWPSRFYDVRPMAGGLMAGVCMPLQPVTALYYAWGKTRGEVFLTPNATVPGAAANDRLCVITTDGSVRMADDEWGSNSKQIAGYVIPRTGGTYGSGDQSIMLQLE